MVRMALKKNWFILTAMSTIGKLVVDYAMACHVQNHADFGHITGQTGIAIYIVPTMDLEAFRIVYQGMPIAIQVEPRKPNITKYFYGKIKLNSDCKDS